MADKIFVYAGTWTVQAKDIRGGGIGIYSYDPETGQLKYIETVREDLAAGMITIDRKRSVLYAIDETTDSPLFYGQGGGGRVVAFSIDPESGKLSELGEEQPSYGTLPAYVTYDDEVRWLIVCNHTDKQAITGYYKDEDGRYHVKVEMSTVTAALYPIGSDGSIGDACDIVSFPDDHTRKPSQTACLHCVRFEKDGEHFVMTNMKQDMILSYRLDKENGKMEECDRILSTEGYFPRYFVFHPSLRRIYLNNEHAHAVDVLEYDEEMHLKFIQRVDTTPSLDTDMSGKKVIQTDILISEDGKHLYDLFRGPNSIMVFEIDERTGLISKKQEFKLGGTGNQRGGAISPDGRFLIVADTDRHLIVTLSVGRDGTLHDTGLSAGGLKYPGNVAFYTPFKYSEI